MVNDTSDGRLHEVAGASIKDKVCVVSLILSTSSINSDNFEPN